MATKLRILHLEDLPTDAELVERELRKGGMVFDKQVVDNRGDFEKALREFSPDIIISDHSLPSFNSIEALRISRNSDVKIPFILVTAAVSEEFAVQMMKEGIDDYLLKDRMTRLPQAVLNAVEKKKTENDKQNYLNQVIANEALMNEAGRLAHFGSWQIDLLNNKALWSDEAYRIFGYKPLEIEPTIENFLNFIHSEDLSFVKPVLEGTIKNLPSLKLNYRILDKKGTVKFIRSELIVERDQEDKPVRLTGFILDVTKMHKAELENKKARLELQSAYEKLKVSEHKFRSLIEQSEDGVAILSAIGKPLYVSPAVKQVLGYTDKEALKMNLFRFAHPEDTAELAKVLENVIANPGLPMKGYTGRMRHKDGSWRCIEATVTNMLHDPAIRGIVSNFRDVTKRKLANEKLIQANRLYALTSQTNQIILRAADDQIVFKEACRIAIEIGKFKAAWIGLIDPEHERINLTEGSGIPPSELFRFTDVSYEKKGPQNHVLNSGSHFVCNNIQRDLEFLSWKQFAAENDFGSIMVLPVRRFGIIIGTFNLYSSEVDFFNKEEIVLLEEVTSDISFALDIFAKDKLRTQAEVQLNYKRLRLKQAQTIAHFGNWDIDFSTGVAIWSEEQLRIYGLQPEESSQTYDSWISFIHPDDIDTVLRITREAQNTFSSTDFFHRIIRKDGSVKHIHSHAQFQFDHEGNAVGLYGVVHDVTGMKEAEEALQRSEANLQAIFENTSEGFILMDVNGIVKSFNNKSQEIIRLNTGQEIAVGESIFDFIAPGRTGNYENAVSSVLSGETLQYDYLFERKNGDRKWFSFTINPVHEAGKISGMCITSSDISERKEAEQQLQESELFNKGILASLSSHITVIDNTGKLIAVNKAWNDFANENGAVFLGDVLEGSNYFDVCKRSDVEGDPLAGEALKGIQSVFNRENQTFEMEYPCHSPEEKRWFVLHVMNFGDDGDKLVISHQDITKRKISEQQLELSQSNLQAIIENTDASIYSLDRNLNYLTFNQTLQNSVEASFGITIKQGDNVYDFLRRIDPEDAKSWGVIYSRALKGETVKFEKEYIFGENHSYTSFSLHPIWENENVVGLSCFALDITRQKQDELQKEKMTADLIQRNKDLEQFSYIVSHNLRMPVANIIGFSEVLKAGNLPKETEKVLNEGLSQSVSKLDDVIKDLNHILQVKQNVNEDKEVVIFSRLTSDIELSIQTLIKKESAVIHTDFSAVDEMLTTKSYLYSIFYNLISNSLKYRQKNITPVIEIKSLKSAGKLILLFKDNGLGIDLGKRSDQVFGLYKRFHLDKAEGKGMGLFMVKTQVEAIGGKIAVTSEVNSGTEFRIEFEV